MNDLSKETDGQIGRKRERERERMNDRQTERKSREVEC